MMLHKGFLATNVFYATYAHQDSQIEQYLTAVEEAFCFLVMAIEKDQVELLLEGPVAHSGFQRLV